MTRPMTGARRLGPRRTLAVAAACAALLLSACSPSAEVTPDTIAGAELTEPYTPLDAPLEDTSGETASLADVDDDLTLVFFGYTHCPDICGIVMSTIASAVTQLDDEERDRVGMVFVTTDPARDTAPVLRSYLDRYDPAFEGLTGDLDVIVEAGRSLKVAVEEGERLPSGGYEVVHGDHVVGLDAEGRGQIVWTKDISARQMASDLKILLAR